MVCLSRTARLAALAVFFFASGAARAEWPEKIVRLVVPFQTGSSSDTIARIIAAKLSIELGKQVIVENKPGASAVIGTNYVAKSAPDGYTLGLANTTSHAASAAFITNLPFDPIKDFTPIAMIGSSPFVLLAPAQGGAQNFEDFVRLARANPGRLSYASAGTATLTYLAGELVKRRMNINVVHVPYRGSEQALVDLISGRIDLLVGTIPPSLSQIQAGTVIAFAVLSATRSPLLPNVPTIGEVGAPGSEAALWTALVSPVGLPPEIIARLNQLTNKIVSAQDVREALTIQGVTPETGSPQELSERMRADIVRWKQVVIDSNLTENK